MAFFDPKKAKIPKPATDDTPKPEPKRKTDPPHTSLSAAEVKRFFAAVAKQPNKALRARDRALFMVMWRRGLRSSEVGKLTLANVKMEEKRIKVSRVKGSKGFEYRLHPDEILALRAWLPIRGGDPGPLFPSRLHKPIDRREVWLLHHNYCIAARIDITPPDPRFPRDHKGRAHVWKHTCGTDMANSGVDLGGIQEHLGHKNLQNTKIYIEDSPVRRDVVADKMEGEYAKKFRR